MALAISGSTSASGAIQKIRVIGLMSLVFDLWSLVTLVIDLMDQ